MKKLQSFAVILFLVTAFLIAVTSSGSYAVERWIVMGNSGWVHDGTALSLDHPSSNPQDLRVTSSMTGDFQYIQQAPPVTLGAAIKQIILCYQTPNDGTTISVIRLNAYVIHTSSSLMDLSPIPAYASGSCYVSPALNLVPLGALQIKLRLNFANPGDAIYIGAMGILIDE